MCHNPNNPIISAPAQTRMQLHILVILHPDDHTADLTAAQQEFAVSNADRAGILSSEAVQQN